MMAASRATYWIRFRIIPVSVATQILCASAAASMGRMATAR